MEIYDPQKKEFRPFTGDESEIPTNLLSAKASTRDCSFLFALKLSFKTQWLRTLIGSLLALFAMIVFDLISLNLGEDINTIRTYIILDSVFFVLYWIVPVVLVAIRMKNQLKTMPETFVEIYWDLILIKEKDETGKILFKMPFDNLAKVFFSKEAYILVFSIENGRASSLILFKKSIQENALSQVDSILRNVNEKKNNHAK